MSCLEAVGTGRAASSATDTGSTVARALCALATSGGQGAQDTHEAGVWRHTHSRVLDSFEQGRECSLQLYT